MIGLKTIRSWLGSAPSPQSPTPSPDTSIKGLVGTPSMGGWLRDLGEYNSKLQPPYAFATYEKMRRSDADVAAVLDACKLPIRAAEYQVLPGLKESDPGYAKAKEIAEFVKKNLFGGLEYEVIDAQGNGRKVSQSFESVVENALLMLDFGCAAHEIIWRVDDDAVRIARFAPRLPHTFSRFVLAGDGETLLEIQQAGYRGETYDRPVVRADKLDFFSFKREGANWWGRSLLRPAYKHWYMKEQLERIDGIAGERTGMGVPVITQGPNASKEDREAAEAWGQNLSTHERVFLSLPNGWTLTLQGVEGTARPILPSIRYHSEMIGRSVLATFLAFGTTQTGARALGESATDFFKMSLESTAWLIAETMAKGSIRQLVRYNFGEVDQELYPSLQFANIMATMPFDLWKTVGELVKGGVLEADDDLEAAGREDLGLPLKGEPRVAPAPVVGAGLALPKEGTASHPPTGVGLEPEENGALVNSSAGRGGNQAQLAEISAAEEGGHWITLENGEHAYIDATGTIAKGPAGLIGKKVGGREAHTGPAGQGVKGAVFVYAQASDNAAYMRAEAGKLVESGKSIDAKGGYASSLIVGIRDADETSDPLYRGIHGQQLEGIGKLTAGQEFQFTKPQSFSKDLGIAKKFTDTSDPNAKAFIFVTHGDVKGIDVNKVLAGGKNYHADEKEVITMGRFRITKVEQRPGLENKPTTFVHLKQKGVF